LLLLPLPLPFALLLLLLLLLVLLETEELLKAEAAEEENLVPAGEDKDRTKWAAGWKGDDTGLLLPPFPSCAPL
jgi:hypothetical protein